MGFVGFNADTIGLTIKTVDNVYLNVVLHTQEHVKNFINSMSKAWACNEAITFFKDYFKLDMESLIKNSTVVFESAVNAMNGAARTWANNTNTIYSNINFSGAIDPTVDTSAIRENINGDRGADAALVKDAINTFIKQMNFDLEKDLSRAVTAVKNSGFIGGSQQSNLISSFENIKRNFSSKMTELTTATNKAITATIDKYGSITTNVENAFLGENI